MAAVGRCEGGHGAARPVGVAGVGGIVVAGGNVVVAQIAGEHEASLAVSHPDAELHAGQRTEHHAVALGDGEAHKLRLEAVADVVLHAGTSGACAVVLHHFPFEQSELYHQLAAVADAEAEGVGEAVEAAQGLLGGLVPAETAGPTLGRAEHVAVGESAAEHYHADVVEGLAAAHQVGHVHIFHIEAGKIERVGHLAVAVHTLLADDGGAHSGFAVVAVGETARSQGAVEGGGDGVAQRLLAVVLEAHQSALGAALQGVEQIGGLEPCIAQIVDAEQALCAFMLHEKHTLALRTSQGKEAHAGFREGLLHGRALGIGHLDHHGGIFGEEDLHEVGLAGGFEAFGADGEAAVGVGECHFKQGGHQSSGAHVVHGQHAIVLHQALHGCEGALEVVGVGHRRSIAADAVEALGEGRAAEPQGIGREVDIIELRFGLLLKHRCHCAAHVGGLARGRDDHGAGGELFFVAIFLCHRQGVLAGGDVDAESHGEV